MNGRSCDVIVLGRANGLQLAGYPNQFRPDAGTEFCSKALILPNIRWNGPVHLRACGGG